MIRGEIAERTPASTPRRMVDSVEPPRPESRKEKKPVRGMPE
jgi:hypothetical protein